jgi:hypothetical protein
MSFDISRLRRADQIVAGGAIAFFIFLFFFKWYGGSASTPIGGVSLGSSLNGWHSFTNSRWLWLLTIIVALGSVVLVAGQRKLEIPAQPSVIVAGLGALSSIFIVYRIIHHPSGGASGGVGITHFSYSYGIKIGIWLGLISALAITYGGYLQMRAEGTSLSDVREQASGAFSGVTAPASGDSSSRSTGGSPATATPPAPPPSAAPPIPPPATPPDPGTGGGTSGPSSDA